MSQLAKAEGKAAVSRARIIAVAAQLFAEHGYEGASIRDIAQAAGMTTASLYYHFSGKDDLFVAVHGRALRGVADAVARAVKGLSDPWDQLEAAVAAHSATLLEKGNASILLSMMYGGVDSVRDKLIAQRDGYERTFFALVDAAPMRPGVDRKLVRLQILGSINFMAFWFQRRGAMSAAEIGHAMIRNLRHGVSPQDNSKKTAEETPALAPSPAGASRKRRPRKDS